MNNPNNSDNHNNALQSKWKETTHNRHTHEKREKFSTHKTTRYITDELEMMEQAWKSCGSLTRFKFLRLFNFYGVFLDGCLHFSFFLNAHKHFVFLSFYFVHFSSKLRNRSESETVLWNTVQWEKGQKNVPSALMKRYTAHMTQIP